MHASARRLNDLMHVGESSVILSLVSSRPGIVYSLRWLWLLLLLRVHGTGEMQMTTTARDAVIIILFFFSQPSSSSYVIHNNNNNNE